MKTLKELRNDAGLTQDELARKLGCSSSSIAMYEIGERTPSLKMAKLIAQFFNIPIENIFFANNAHEMRADNPRKAG